MTERRDRRREGLLIKRAVLKAIPESKVRVRAGQGTAYGWWNLGVEAPTTAFCSCSYQSNGIRNNCGNCGDRCAEVHRLAEAAVQQSGATVYNYTSDMDDKCSCISVNVSLRGQNQPEAGVTA